MLNWLRKLWPFHWPWKPEDVPEPTNPILLIPGICGTQLAVRDKADESKDVASRVWVCIEHADKEYRQLWGRVDEGTGHLELLDEAQEVCIPQKDPTKDPVEDDGGLFPVDILDPSLYVPLHVVYYFHNLIWFLKKHRFEPAKTLFGFGYDFRQSNMSHMDALVARLEAASAAKDGAKVDVITHSMGGLVMRSLLALRPDDYSRLVRKWIAIASPFGGAPGFGMDALMTGVEFCQGWEQYFFVNRRTMHAMCSQAPAVFELLPDPARPEVWPLDRRPPQCHVFRKERPGSGAADSKGEEVESEGADVGGEAVHVQLKDSISEHGNVVRKDSYSISEFRTVLEGSLKEFEVETYKGKLVKLPMNPKCWEISDRARDAWRGRTLPEGTQFFNIFGTGYDTAYDVTYGAPDEPLEELTEIAADDPPRRFSWIDGDCTVPICCAVADGLDAVERKGFFATHRGLLEVPHVWETIMDYIDLPMDASTAKSSANAFPESHAVSAQPPAGSAAATSSPGAAVLKAVRGRKHAAVRREAHERSRQLREAWEGQARPRQGAGALDSRRSVDGGWVMVHGQDAPGGASGRRSAQSTASGEVIVNPLHQRTMSGSSQ
eukprot:jgi/Ulvmu1/9360/UM050_0112.1